MADPQFRSAQELRAHYRAVNARIEAAALRFQEEKRRAADEPSRQDARRASYDAHMDNLAAQYAEGLKALNLRRTPHKIIEGIAAHHNVTAEAIIGPLRTERMVRIRWEAIAAVRAAYPEKSLLALGRIFKRDHTTILHALRRGRPYSGRQEVAA